MHRVFKRRRHLVLLPQRSSLYRATTSLHFILLNYFIGIKAALYKSVDLLSSSGSELNGLGGSFQLQQQQTKKLQLTATLVELYTVYTQYVLHTQMLCYSVGVGIVECYAMLCYASSSTAQSCSSLLCCVLVAVRPFVLGVRAIMASSTYTVVVVVRPHTEEGSLYCCCCCYYCL